ncbi:MAG: ATP-binding cassette domain-containing protein [Candidatus Nanopelagicales bacterium]|nr:ATP-binding cassette domain-containing protein [Candidatus Nanopelagicales bacterium]
MQTPVPPEGSAAVPTGAMAVELRGITKTFPGVVANSDVNLAVRRGTVHAIVGENGAGKSTLMKTLYGMHKPDAGEILVDGEQVVMHSPADAIEHGIGMVHQHFKLADNFTVLENIVLGAEPRAGVALDFGQARERIVQIAGDYGLEVDPDTLVEDLGVGDRQRVEILKVLYRGARTLILDEPTAVLVPQEVDELFDALNGLKAEGLAILFISHKLDEVLKVADDITVIRRGTTVATVDPKQVTARQLAELMVGSELPSPETRESTVTDTPVLVLDDVGLVEAGRVLLADIGFTIHAGEVLGIAGVEGNGQAELVETIMGMRHASTGTIRMGDTDITLWSTRARREAGVAYIPEDRIRHGLLLESPLWENRILGHQTRVRRAHPRHRRARRSPVRWQPAEADRRPRDEREPEAAHRGPPDPGRRRRCPGRHLGPPAGGAGRWPGGAAHLRRPRRADRPVRHAARDPARAARGAGRPRDGDPRAARVGHDRCGPWRAPGERGMSGRLGRIGVALIAPVLAIVSALLITSVVLMLTGHQPLAVFQSMIDYGTKPRSMTLTINAATTYYLSALAVAIGFKMNLFNIGVDGQYRLAAMLAAAVGGAVTLPPVLHVALIVLVAMVVGAFWAGIAGLLRTTRGVSEVISTIMLNFIATGIVAYLLTPGRLAEPIAGSNNIGTAPIPPSGHVPGIPLVPGAPNLVYGFIVIAAVAGAIYWFVLSRTRFGFDLRATGANEAAAVASGVNVKRMIVITMLLSGAVAGLVGMPQLLGGSYTYSLDFPAGLGFTGIAIALLGRNSPIGIAFGALLWAFLENSSQILDLEGVPKEIVQIMQGVIVLSVVIAYELVRRWQVRRVAAKVGTQLGTAAPAAPATTGASA